MKKPILILISNILTINFVFSQGVSINNTGLKADTSAMLDVSGTTKGVLLSRMTTAQRNAIVSPAKGLMIYNLDCNIINYNAGTPSGPNWVPFNRRNCGTLTDSRDGKTYPTVEIGGLCWMAKNLNYGTFVEHTAGQGAAGIQKYCAYDDSANCSIYGGLYVWEEMMDGASACNGTDSNHIACATPVQGICPDGWHIPSHYESVYLARNLGSSPYSFPYDETTKGWLGTDEGDNAKVGGCSGFDVLYGGYYYYGPFLYVGEQGIFYTCSQDLTKGYARWGFNVDISLSTFFLSDPDHNDGINVRCVKN